MAMDGAPPAYADVMAEKDSGVRSVDVVAVVDVSLSMDDLTTAAGNELTFTKLQCAIQAASLVADVADRIAVVTYAKDAQVLLPMGPHSSGAVQAAFGRVLSAGSTNIEAGLRAAATQLGGDAGDDRVQLVIMLTDGQPNCGIQSATGLAAIARDLPATVCTAGFGKGKSIDPKMLAAMADEGGGVFLNIPDATSLGTGFASMVAAARAWDVPPPDIAALPDPGATDALADALSDLALHRDPFANHLEVLQERLGPFRLAVPGFADDLASEIVPGYVDSDKFEMWGCAYMLAIALAYRRRIAITHFDKGLAAFRDGHPIVAERYARYSAMYNAMPAPAPRRRFNWNTHTYDLPEVEVAQSFETCAAINDADDGCVDGDTPLLMDGAKTIAAKDVTVGTKLFGGTVTHILYSKPNRVVEFRRLPCGTLITPWHPVAFEGAAIDFPAQRSTLPTVRKHCAKLVTFELASDAGGRLPFFCCGERIGAHSAVLALNAGIEGHPVATHPFWGTSAWRDTHPDPGPVYRHVGVERSAPDADHPQGRTTQWRAA